MHIEMNELGRRIGTIFAGEAVREKIMDGLANKERVKIDFAGVQYVSASFAEECFGKLKDSYDEKFIKHHLEFINMSSKIDAAIYDAMQRKVAQKAVFA